MDECIIETLSYFDIFDYPLTFSEIKKYFCCEIEFSDEEFLEIIRSIPIIQESNGFFYFLGRNEISEKRMDRSEISVGKYAKAKIIGHLLSYIPSIEYIGVSGSLSMNNAAITDDIDFFFITKKNTLWITRLAVNIVLLVSQQKRIRGEKDVMDKICPNMFLDEGKLTFSEKRKTLYTAHELVQLKTLYDRDNFHERLLSKNKWINVFFPNILVNTIKSNNYEAPRIPLHFIPGIFSASFTALADEFILRVITKLLTPFEKTAFYLQKEYMKKHRSKEIVTKGRALFHPIDRQKMILDLFLVRAKRYKDMNIDNLWVDRDEARFYMEDKKIRILN